MPKYDLKEPLDPVLFKLRDGRVSGSMRAARAKCEGR